MVEKLLDYHDLPHHEADLFWHCESKVNTR
jgi:hypothetical protein